jgi:class 3 adenylate cyclase
VGNVRAWLEANGFTRFADTFEENEIDGEALLELTAEHLKDFGIALGPRLKLLKAIQSLRSEADEKLAAAAGTAKPDSPISRGPEAERRHLTVMFVDLVGSTELAARLDPEDMSTLIRAYQNTVAGEITRFEGHIAKHMGDAACSRKAAMLAGSLERPTVATSRHPLCTLNYTQRSASGAEAEAEPPLSIASQVLLSGPDVGLAGIAPAPTEAHDYMASWARTPRKALHRPE